MKKIVVSVLVCVVLTIAIFLLLFGLKDCMTIRSNQTNKVLYQSPITQNLGIEFSYIHSVSLTPIIEELNVTQQGFYLQKVIYIDQGGAGMPEFASGKQSFSIEEGKFVIDGFDRFFENIVINVQEKYDDQIKIEETIIDLDQLLGGNGKVILNVEKRLVFKY
jgi:hypothetical protein